MSNIDAFDIAVAEVLGDCYKHFPQRITIYDMKVGAAIKEAFGDDPQGIFNLSEFEYKIAEDTTAWLIDAGYLWCEQRGQTAFEQVTLTPKALEVLKAIPDSINPGQSLGDRLSTGVKVLGKEAALTVVKLALATGVNLVNSS